MTTAAKRRGALCSWLILALPACLWLWSLARFYRRFIYDEPTGRVWAVSDDMYISACFGRSLFSGHGLLWYKGAPRIEGISNPLWTLLIGALHKLPGFSEDRLGIFVIVLNAVLLVSVVVFFARSARYALTYGVHMPPSAAGAGSSEPTDPLESSRAELSAPLLAAAPLAALSGASALLLPWCVALAYWSAEGFEVALLAALAFAALYLALLPRTRARALGLGLLLVAGVATRMDFVVLASASLLVAVAHKRGERAHLVWTGALCVVLLSALLIARRVYYGDWLPNTYYLKTTGWPLASRLGRGIHQNSAMLLSAALSFVPLALPRVRQNLGATMPCVVAGWVTYAAAVLYSTYVGGDAWNLVAGYDRHTAAASVFLAYGNCLLISGATRARWTRSACSAWCLLLAAAPVFAQDGAGQLQRGLFAASSRERTNERDWIEYGKQLREISLPGARIALCPAGAIVYFSHRGGVDLLGKVDRFVAHLPVAEKRPRNMACWRNAPGHNKGDDAQVFANENPDFARGKIPWRQRSNYFHIKYKTNIFFVRKGTPYLEPSFGPSSRE